MRTGTSTGPGRRPSEAGVTLPGLLAVLIVIAIVSGMAYRNMGGASERLAVRAEVRRVQAHVATARARAVSEGRPYALVVSAGSHLDFAARSGGVWRSIGPRTSLPAHVSLSVDGAGDARIAFAPSGRAYRPHTVVLRGGMREERIDVLASGAMTREPPGGPPR